MLCSKHALFQSAGRIAFGDRDLGLSEHFASVQLVGDEVDGAPARVSPAAIARECVSRPRYLGSREGWILTICPAQCSTNPGDKMRMKPARAIVPMLCSSRAELSARS